jgi:hypothetical protein
MVGFVGQERTHVITNRRSRSDNGASEQRTIRFVTKIKEPFFCYDVYTHVNKNDKTDVLVRGGPRLVMFVFRDLPRRSSLSQQSQTENEAK